METKLNELYNYTFNDSHKFDGHKHKGYEINIVLEGQMEIVYDSSVLRLNNDEVLIGAPFLFHRNKCINSAHFVVFQFDCDTLSDIENFAILKLNDSSKNLLNIILEEYENEGEITENAQKLFDVFLDLIKKEATPQTAQTLHPVFTLAVEYMKENLDKTLKIKDISKVCNVCETTLKKIFKESVGIGVSRYFSQLKIDKAYELILSGKSCSETAVRLGFSSPAYFSYCFKEITGKSPRNIKTKK